MSKLKNKFQDKNIVRVIFAVFLVVYTIFLVFMASKKCGYHMDELFTYSLANNPSSAHVYFTEGQVYNGKDFLANYTAARKGNLFDYNMVYVNQVNDVHPPMYYFVIHTLCSIFSGRFLPQIGWAVNMVAALLSAICVFFIVKEFTDDKWICLMMTIATAFCPGVVENVIYIRMYALASLFALVFTLLHLKFIKKDSPAFSKQSLIYGLLMFVTAYVGALTHYYVSVFLFFLAIYGGLYLLFRLRIGDLLIYVLSIGAAEGLAYLTFPAMRTHMLASPRGSETLTNIRVLADLKERLAEFFAFINQSMFGNTLLALFLIGLVALIIGLTLKKKEVLSNIGQWGLMLFPCLCFFLFVSKTAEMIEERYLFTIYPLAFVCCILPLISLLYENNKRNQVYAVILALILGSAYIGYDFPLLYSEQGEQNEIAQSYKDDTAVVVYQVGKEYQIPAYITQLSIYDKLVFISDENIDTELSDFVKDSDELVVYTKTSDDKKVLKVLSKKTGGSPEKMFAMKYANMYVIK